MALRWYFHVDCGFPRTLMCTVADGWAAVKVRREISGMEIKRRGSAICQGGTKDGKRAISIASGALRSYPYGFASRFEGLPGTNPEELLGAAHAGCFTMALSLILGEAGLTADKLETTAEVTLAQVDGAYAITAVHLILKGTVPGTDQAR